MVSGYYFPNYELLPAQVVHRDSLAALLLPFELMPS